jgi:predicted transcriptional regulator
MKSDIEEGARLAAEIAKRPSRMSHLPKDVVRAAMAYTRRGRSAGALQLQIARELGVSMMTIRRWVVDGDGATARRRRRTKKPKMRAVRVVDNARGTATAIVATTRDGIRIEGLTVPELVAVLRGLG